MLIVDLERFATLPLAEEKENIPPRADGIISSLELIAAVEKLSSRPENLLELRS
jgi:hypothetical protein